jgi:hypothetical protein
MAHARRSKGRATAVCARSPSNRSAAPKLCNPRLKPLQASGDLSKLSKYVFLHGF